MGITLRIDDDHHTNRLRVVPALYASILHVMAGLVPSIHVLSRENQDMDARDEPGHDD